MAWRDRREVTLGMAIVRIALGLLFAWAAVSKLRDPVAFADDIANYRLLPASWVAAATAVVPGLELVVAGLLLVGIYVRAAAIVTAGMLLIFIVALAQALGRGVNLTCGCFGSSSEPATIWTVMRDVGLLGMAAVVAVGDRVSSREP